MPCEIVPKYLQEEETLNQECKQLVSTLPKERGWVGSHLYHYHGFWYPVRYLQGLLSCHKHFRLENSDVFLVTTPKSGTTWLKAILFALSNRAAFPIAKSHPLYTTNPHDLVPFLEIKLYVDNQIPDLSALPSPRLFSTHLPHASLPGCVRESRSCKIVYLCRNPMDVFVSLWHFTNRLRNQESYDKGTGSNSIDEVFDMFCRGVSLFGPFWDHALEYWKQSKQSPERVMFLRFEDIKLQPGIHIRRLAQFLECPFSPVEEESGLVDQILELCSFDHLSALEINKNGKLSSGEENKAFFRRGVVGDWRNYMDDEMVERMDRITQDKFAGSGLIL